MKKVYVAHPYGGDPENMEKVERIIKRLYREHPHILFISPIHLTGFVYNDMSYAEGIGYCFELLSMCDELWLFGNWPESKGCNLEECFAKMFSIPVVYMDGREKEQA